MDIHDLERKVREEYQLDYVTSTGELENILNDIGVPRSNLSGIDLRIAKDITEAFGAIIKKYPALKRTICAVGSKEFMDELLIDINDIDQSGLYRHFCDRFTLDLTAVSGFSKHQFFGIAIGDSFYKNTYEESLASTMRDVQKGFHPKSCSTIHSYVYHEIGHILDNVLKLSYDMEIVRIFNEEIKDLNTDISGYADYKKDSIGKRKEGIAEAFAEYMMNQNTDNEIIRMIGERIDRMYNENKRSFQFMINGKYRRKLLFGRK